MAAGIGSTPSLVIGIAAGAAASAALEPALEIPKQEAWQGAKHRIPDIALVARLYVTGQTDYATAVDMAGRLGFNEEKFAAYAYLAQETPSTAEVMSLWRRFSLGDLPAGALPEHLVNHALAHEGLDWDYAPYIKQMKTANLVGLGDIATAIVRGALPSPSYMPVTPPTTGLSVPRFPQVHIDPEDLAAAIGFSPEQLHLMVARSGLSLAPMLAANALFRGLINEQDFLLAIAEGDLRTEWADTLKDAARQILTVGEYVEAHLRGWTDEPTMYENTAKHGMSKEDTDLAFQVKGRPIAIHQVTTGLARGGTYPSTYADVPEPFRKALEESDIRPEWASLAYANRYSYPSAFVLRSLAEAGDLGDTAAVEQILLEIGWPPHLAKEVAAKWVPSTVAATDPHVKKAQTTLFTEAHKAYVKSGLSVAQVTPAFTALNIPDAAQAQIVGLWDVEKQLAADVPPAA